MASKAESAHWNATEAFSNACKKLIQEKMVPSLAKKEFVQKDEVVEGRPGYFGGTKFGSVPLEHPDIDPRWICTVSGRYGYIGKFDFFAKGFHTTVAFKTVKKEALRQIDTLDIPTWKDDARFQMRFHLIQVIWLEELYIELTYIGPTHHPKRSKKSHLGGDGGDSEYFGDSDKNPQKEKGVFLTPRTWVEDQRKAAEWDQNRWATEKEWHEAKAAQESKDASSSGDEPTYRY